MTTSPKKITKGFPAESSLKEGPSLGLVLTGVVIISALLILAAFTR